jgi:transglutaminase-like putative cysteine protease
MYYTIRHVTRFRYSAPITQSVMEVRMQPRTEGSQRCLNFQLNVTPQAKTQFYRDYLDNIIHHFDIPGQHRMLSIIAESQVEIRTPPELPVNLPASAWEALDGSQYDGLLPSHFTYPTPLLHDLAGELGALERRDDPLTMLRDLTAQIYDAFGYEPESTKVDSPIDDALQQRKGVCQDFTHIMLAMLRPLGIPCRYVSGYLLSRNGVRSAPGASHAWIEALLPGLGWVGFDPTNNLIATDRHIRVAIGRDYADVPPTRGVFKGKADTELNVAVRVATLDEPPGEIPPVPAKWVMEMAAEEPTPEEVFEQQQQQQQ